MGEWLCYNYAAGRFQTKKFKRERKGQTYKTAEIILLCRKAMCLFCTEPFTRELIAERHSMDSSESELSLQVRLSVNSFTKAFCSE